MSNFKNAFGNAGWIQSLMDKSRGKRRPGERQRDAAASNAANRKDILANEPMVQKYGGLADSSKNSVLVKAVSKKLRQSIMPKKT